MGIRRQLARLAFSRRLPSSEPDTFKKILRVTQTGPEIEILVELSSDAVAKRLLVQSPTNTWLPISSFELKDDLQPGTNAFIARFSWEDTALTERLKSPLGRSTSPATSAVEAEPFALFVEVTAPADRFSDDPQPDDYLPNGALDAEAPDRARGWLALGRFARTEISGRTRYSSRSSDYLIYPTNQGNLALVVDVMPHPHVRVHIEKAQIEDEELRFRGTLYTHHTEPTELQFALEGRDTDVVLTAPLIAEEDTGHPAEHWGHRSYFVSASVPLRELLTVGVGDDVFTAWVLTTADGVPEPHRARVGVSRYLVRRHANEASVQREGWAALISTYYTFRANKLSLNVEFFEAPQLRQMLTEIDRSGSRRTWVDHEKPVWLIGEQNYKAQDTGLAFFRFMRAHHREIDAYYVIADDAPDTANLDGLDNVIGFRSAEHLDLFFKADRIISSHHPEYIYPSKSRMLQRAVKPVRVFLQHGVFGVRRLDKLYGRHAPGFHTDLFIVSSEREKRSAITDLGYQPEEVAVTGLSRFDTLFDGTVAVKERQILIMPTWREWLQTEHAFLNSLYFAHWRDFLSSPRLSQLLVDNDAEAVLLLHPNMRKFAAHLQSPRVRLVRQGEESVQNLLKESAVLVTDYSSVGFDFSFLYKPVLYYQFDSGKFLAEGSHIDLDAELPGPITWSQDGLLDEIEDVLDRGATIEPEYRERVDSLVAFRDTNNCERIFAAVQSCERRSESLAERYNEHLLSAERIVRKRRQYIPVMKRVFKTLKLLPARDDLIVFESGRGSQMSDSPKAIYDELVRRGDTRTKVWVYDKKVKVSDRHTRIVAKFSPAYFWYLARAKYWVSNQHFPDYLTRRRNGVFVQTWHGTPLKRMMHDHPFALAKDPTLVERFTRAINQWTHLVSPSPFATDAFASAFRHNAEVLETGYPRNDSLLAPKAGRVGLRTRRKLGIARGATTVLYAPTFRDDKPAGGNRYYFDPPFAIEELVEALGSDHVLLLRLHHLTKNRPHIPDQYADRILDVSNYPNLNEIFLASDALITDYSSIYFDYAPLRRPIAFFPYDLDIYRDEVRGFYLDYERDLPGPVVTDLNDLPAALAREQDVLTDREDFLRRFAPHEDGQAAERVVDRIFGSI